MNDKEWGKQVCGGRCFCEICGQTLVILDPHHYKHKSTYPQLRHEIRNGICICRTCHIKAHSAGGLKFIEDWMHKNRPADKEYCDRAIDNT